MAAFAARLRCAQRLLWWVAGGLRLRRGRAAVLLTGLLLLAATVPATAQRLQDFAYADSLTRMLARQQRWAALDSVGRAARRLGTDYPALRRRLGQGALATGHPAATLRYAGPALRQNPLDDSARVELVLARLALNQSGAATLLAAGLSDSLRRALHLPRSPQLSAAEWEASVLSTPESLRGTATYQRLALAARLSPRLSAEGGGSYYHQTVQLPVSGSRSRSESRDIAQLQLNGLLTWQLSPDWQLKGGYSYIGHDAGQRNHLGFAALALARPLYTAQAGVYAGVLTDTARVQASLRGTVYPLGNLRFYVFGRGSVVWTAGRGRPNGLLGLGQRLRPWLWAEAWGSLGQVPVLAEADGTYVYNLLDPLRGRAAASLLILPGHRLRGRIVCGAEQRHLAFTRNGTYTLYSLTAGLAWNW